MESIQIPAAANELISRLEKTGQEAYVVGGCVRDSLMGKAPHDWDVCTSATPGQVRKALPGWTIIDTGVKHGTVTVMVDRTPYEVTTFRTEGTYSDGRHPDRVEFVNRVEIDLARRDFTVNAMAYNDRTGLVDPYGGRYDLARKTIRAVRDAPQRFQEDGLRILRALRFASMLGFALEESTSQAVKAHCLLLRKISAERIRCELGKLLA